MIWIPAILAGGTILLVLSTKREAIRLPETVPGPGRVPVPTGGGVPKPIRSVGKKRIAPDQSLEAANARANAQKDAIAAAINAARQRQTPDPIEVEAQKLMANPPSSSQTLDRLDAIMMQILSPGPGRYPNRQLATEIFSYVTYYRPQRAI